MLREKQVNNNCVVYLMSGSAHCPYLLVSLYTLRQYWSSNVCVYAWPESYGIVEQIARDKRLFVDQVRCREPQYRGKNSQFLDKIRLVQSMKGEVDGVLYLDADTSIHGSLQLLFDYLNHYSFVATQFNDWLASGNRIRGRIDKLRGLPGINERAIDVLYAGNYPSVNGGVWTCRPDSPVLPTWEAWTSAGKNSVFIVDEATLHVMQVVHAADVITVTDNGRFNTSPKFQSKQLADEDVTIMHYHGDSNVRPSKSQRGYNMWWPMWKHCLEENVGNCQAWYSSIDNKFMKALESNDG
jgi:hypothetical protein